MYQFLNSSDMDLHRKKLTVLSPKPGKLPSTTALIGVRMHISLLWRLTYLPSTESTMAGHVA